MAQRIVVLGLGYVGCVTAACLARLGHHVLGVDPDDHKVRSVLAGQAPFYEPGLAEIVRETVDAGRFLGATSIAGSLDGADVVLVCVGTPSERNGNLGLGQLRQVVAEIGQELRRIPSVRPPVVAVRSTVFPGTCDEVVIPALEGSGAAVVSNPEFLREGSAVADFLDPSLLVVGGELEAARRVSSLYDSQGIEPCLVSLRTAEMIKYSCNSFHAVKIAFANEVGSLCAELGISGREVMETLCRDTRLNISTAYLKPGFAFGGSCLPKDLRALTYRAAQLNVKAPLLESVMPSNDRHLQRAIQAVLDLEGRLGIFGLAFKENTDDLRESPVVILIEQLLGKGRDLRIFDPHIRIDQIYGSNRRFVLAAIPHISRLLDEQLADTLSWASHLVLAQKPSPEAASAIRASGIQVLDLAGGW